MAYKTLKMLRFSKGAIVSSIENEINMPKPNSTKGQDDTACPQLYRWHEHNEVKAHRSHHEQGAIALEKTKVPEAGDWPCAICAACYG